MAEDHIEDHNLRGGQWCICHTCQNVTYKPKVSPVEDHRRAQEKDPSDSRPFGRLTENLTRKRNKVAHRIYLNKCASYEKDLQYANDRIKASTVDIVIQNYNLLKEVEKIEKEQVTRAETERKVNEEKLSRDNSKVEKRNVMLLSPNLMNYQKSRLVRSATFVEGNLSSQKQSRKKVGNEKNLTKSASFLPGEITARPKHVVDSSPTSAKSYKFLGHNLRLHHNTDQIKLSPRGENGHDDYREDTALNLNSISNKNIERQGSHSSRDLQYEKSMSLCTPRLSFPTKIYDPALERPTVLFRNRRSQSWTPASNSDDSSTIHAQKAVTNNSEDQVSFNRSKVLSHPNNSKLQSKSRPTLINASTQTQAWATPSPVSDQSTSMIQPLVPVNHSVESTRTDKRRPKDIDHSNASTRGTTSNSQSIQAKTKAMIRHVCTRIQIMKPITHESAATRTRNFMKNTVPKYRWVFAPISASMEKQKLIDKKHNDRIQIRESELTNIQTDLRRKTRLIQRLVRKSRHLTDQIHHVTSRSRLRRHHSVH